MNILNRLTIKHLKMNKKRTVVTIIGVILSCALMVGVGLMLSSLQRNLVLTTEKNSGKHHATINNIDSDKFNIVKQNVNVKDVNYEQIMYMGKVPDALMLESTNDKDNNSSLNEIINVKNANDGYLDTLIISEGRKPVMNNEIIIPLTYQSSLETPYKLGDKINIDEIKYFINGKETKNVDELYQEDIDIKEEKVSTKEYKIVGFYSSRMDYGAQAKFYTKDNINNYNNIKAYITYKSASKVEIKTESIASKLDKKLVKADDGSKYYEDLDYNWSLLSAYGQSKYDNYNQMMYQILAIILGLISVACIIVIYNSFNISVMERKKQFGLFSSIGATKRQLRYTVFYEAVIVAVIGLPLGVISGYVGISTVITIINNLMPDMMDPALQFYSYPIFTIIPVLFMIIVIFLSAYLPAKRASKVTPIEAIRQNDDIKIKGKKVKTNRIIKKIFGIEGDIALKNMKRNKKKYRITVVSIFISIVLFISFTGFLKYGLYGTNTVFDTYDYDGEVHFYDNSMAKIDSAVKKVTADSGVIKSTLVGSDTYTSDKFTENDYVKEYYDIAKDSIYNDKEGSKNSQINLVTLDKKSYEKYVKQLNLKENRPIIINKTNTTYYEDGSRKTYVGEKIKKRDSLTIYNPVTNDNGETIQEEIAKLDNLFYTDKVPFGLSHLLQSSAISVIIDEDTYNNIHSIVYEELIKSNSDNQSYSLYMKLDKENNIQKIVDDINDKKEVININYMNIHEMQKTQRNMVLVIKLLLYGFIALVTLIGITSVFNTINTSLLLRKKEFAMLRSIGLTPKGFNKILWFESFFFVFKAVIYSLPVSFGIIYLIHMSMGSSMSIPYLLIPWLAIGIAIVFAFLIVLMTTIYSTRKMRKENILEAIRTENI